MATLDHLREWMLRSRRTYLAGVALTLLVLAATVVVGWLLARTLIRDQISRRDADLLYAATLMEQIDLRNGHGTSVLKTDEQVGFDAAILASRMKGVIGIRFFDPQGRFTDAFPATIHPHDLDAHTLEFIGRLEPHSDFRDATLMSDIFIYLPAFATGRVERIPLLEVTVPLHRQDSKQVLGAAQFLVEGHSIAQQYRALDRHLAGLAGQTLLIAGALLGLVLWLVLRKVEHLTARLALQNRELSRANEELAMAARGSALGAISSHLMHGLKNPLASLSRYVRDHESDALPNGTYDETEDWQDALAATRRMQALVEHTMEVLADSRGDAVYEISMAELARDIARRTKSLAEARGVRFEVQTVSDTVLSSRVANLVGLVLVNLVENALQATPHGKCVSLELEAGEGRLTCRVRDEGPGFPPQLRQRLFLPCRSTREGGSGIGLSISKQIADHLGSTLELAEAPDGGCLFTVSLPLVAQDDAPVATARRPLTAG